MQNEVAIDLGEEQTFDFVMKQIKERLNLYRMLNFDDSDPVYQSNYQNYLIATKDKLSSISSNNNLLCHKRTLESLNSFKARDGLSHIMIRYSIQNDFEKVFLDKEAKLFQMRLQDVIIDSRMDQSETSFVERVADVSGTERITPEEFNNVRKELGDALKQDPDKLRLNAFIKIRFNTVPKVVSSRRCIIKKGWVQCSINEQKIQIVDQFKKNLMRNIAFDKNVIQQMRARNLDFSDVHKEIFKSIKKELVGLSHELNQFDSKELKNVNSMDLKTLYDIMNESKVPPCVKQMQDSMKTQNHLKFMGRFMFTSFLKNIGASENVAENFLRQEFSHSNINSTDFDKHYKQNIRHLYGLEGSRKDQNVPHSCTQQATNLPASPEQAHGCPQKHMDATRLRQFLKKNQIRNDYQNYVLNEILSNRNNYTQACSTTFNYSQFAVQKDEHGRDVPQTFNKNENSSQPVRFSIKAMQITNMKIDDKKYQQAQRTNLEKDNNVSKTIDESNDDTSKVDQSTFN